MKQSFLFLAVLAAFPAIAQPKWQQRVDTKIEVSLDDKKHFLHATEEFTYTNNSPDTLKFIYLHLWPNAYLNDHTPFAKQQDRNGNTNFYYAKPKDRGFIDSLKFMVDGKYTEFAQTQDEPDIARIDLETPLYPGKRIVVSTPFRVKVPKVFSRMGHSGQAYYISQWFPKPAVYDTKGWHPISYLDQGEFYSEYGSYDVAITLPANYVVMATGNCLDETENNWLDKKSKDSLPSDTLYKKSTPYSTPETKTIHFHEDNVHDFAWFADKRWIVRKDTAVSPGNNLVVTTYTAFLPQYQKLWKHGNDNLKETIHCYGSWVGPYQYKTIKAVLGDMKAGGGMEYPTVTIIDKAAQNNLKTVIIHEAGHNWFYGMLGSNERDHAWMDEGMNSFYEQKTTIKDHDTIKNYKVARTENLILYEFMATSEDQPIEQTSDKFKKLNYGLDVYFKTAVFMRWMEKYMGEADFSKGMKEYFDTWHFHHPYPEDFRKIMEKNTPKSLGWFFDTLLQTDHKIDFKITKARINGNNTEVTIKNKSGISLPVMINAYSKDSIISSGWAGAFARKTTITLATTDWTKIKIDNATPDVVPANNAWKRHALIHNFGLKMRPFIGFNESNKIQFYFAPAIGANHYDGFMLGLVFHNLTVPENRFRFALVPMYGFASQQITGAGSIGYVWFPRRKFKEVILQVDGKSFHDYEPSMGLKDEYYNRYTKIAPSITFTFHEHDAQSPVIRTLLLKGYSITKDTYDAGHISLGKATSVSATNYYGLIRYSHDNRRTYNPFSFNIEGQMGADFAKLSAEGKIKINYNIKNKALYVRGFVGKYFPITNDLAVTSIYQLNSSYSGKNDYLYDGTYYNRNDINGHYSEQISIQEGGFKVPVYGNVSRSDNWMATLNLETDLPRLKLLPIRLFFDVGLIPNATPSISNASSSTLLYDGGVEIALAKNVLNVYIPIIMSNDYQNYVTNTFGNKNKWNRSVSFTLMLQNINWLKETSKQIRSSLN